MTFSDAVPGDQFESLPSETPSVLTPTFLSLCQSKVLARIRSCEHCGSSRPSECLELLDFRAEKKSQGGIWSPLHFLVESPEPRELPGGACSPRPSQPPDSSPASGARAANSGTVCFLPRPPGRPASHTWNAPSARESPSPASSSYTTTVSPHKPQ